LGTRLSFVELGLDFFKSREHFSKLFWLVNFPVLLRSKTDTRAVCTTTHVRTAVGRSRCPSGANHCRNRQASSFDFALKLSYVRIVDQCEITCWQRILP